MLKEVATTEDNIFPNLASVSESDIDIARYQLNSGTSSEYLLGNNRGNSEDVALDMDRLKALPTFLPSPRRVVSIGIGGGLELNALTHLFRGQNTKIIGLELSRKVIEYAQNYLDQQNVEAEIIEGSATDMPFLEEGNKVDGMLMSYVLHEIYSYFPDGTKAWEKSIQGAAHSLSENGILLVQDFAAPQVKGDVALDLRSHIAREFYDYYRARYKTFMTWDESKRKKMTNKRTNFSDYPESANDASTVRITLDRASEFMLHFRNYLRQDKTISGGDPEWKEIDECYLPELDPTAPLTPIDYLTRITQVGSETLQQDGYRITCVQHNLWDRHKTANLLREHFGLTMEGITDTTELFNQITRKAEYVFKKIPV